ncbi:unnamed protein product [Cyberlindnera jadinii]|uniref:Uncharacterized protein n=1 Tax=Cyberlindnera jadinii (strain ATCC 18201 / CBS 1600 / BCRC 20928 / JCM 3617 / NBRC 0987 / NRRL Y-1542) TaxID=983966 RepID=A0A0H5C115_CYBJN|nr:unnamed protein product [Cyberlindnera jadinii]
MAPSRRKSSTQGRDHRSFLKQVREQLPTTQGWIRRTSEPSRKKKGKTEIDDQTASVMDKLNTSLTLGHKGCSSSTKLDSVAL